eukprot:scaffold301_cov393-Prasinococcus_capsulatus_cf.AAC.11
MVLTVLAATKLYSMARAKAEIHTSSCRTGTPVSRFTCSSGPFPVINSPTPAHVTPTMAKRPLNSSCKESRVNTRERIDTASVDQK